MFTGGLEARKLEIFGKKGGRDAGVDWAGKVGEGERGEKVECKSLVDGWLEPDFNHLGRSPSGKEAPGVPWGQEQGL